MSGLTKEQLEQRKNWVGASEVACLLGLSPFGTVHSVWAEKMGLTEDNPTDEQKAGNYLEEGLARWYADENGYTVESRGSIEHPKCPFMGCTPDLWVVGESRIAQIKLVGMWMAHHWEDGVPEYVQLQIQHEMEVANVDVCDVVALIGGTDFRVVPIERDREIGQALVTVCHDFMRRYVWPREMPPVDGSPQASAALKALYRSDNGQMLPPTDETDRLAREWLAADERLGAAEKERECLTNELKSIIGESLGIEGSSYRVRWSKGAKSRVFTCKEIKIKKARAA